MRFILKVVLSLLLLFLFVKTHAQFNVNSLFETASSRIPGEAFRIVPASQQVVIDSTTFEDLAFGDSLNGWKHWSFVENYNFGKDRGALPMITDLNSLHPFFRDQVRNLIEICKTKGIEIAVVETYRTHAKQHEYKTMGKKYTNSAAGRSKHQYGL